MLLASIGLMFVPQANLLNYYFCVAIAVVLPLTAAIFAARRAPLASTLAAVAVLAAIPLVIVAVGALFVRNCDPLTGLAHYAMNPLMGALYGAAVGIFVGSFLTPSKATLAVVAWWFATVLANLWHFYNHPPIFAYNPFVGYFSGSVYDNVIPITATWLWYRLNTAAQIALLLLLAYRRFPIAAGFGCVVLVFALQRGAIGYEMSRDDIIERLGGEHTTEHFVIYYDEDSAVADRIELLAADHEFRYHQLSDLLGVAPDEPITSFVYADSGQKQALMGAGKTYIAKPWSGEVHLNAIEVGDAVLKHELGHVFGASISDGWLGIPTWYGVLPQMAVVEGFAVAVTWSEGRLSPHQWSAAMQELEIVPPLDTILRPDGFLATHAGQAYTLSGSFLRWLLDTHGVARFQAMYAGGDIAAAYDAELPGLVAQWEAFLADRTRVPLTEADLGLARFHFDAPSKFHRVCALEVAGWERDARTAAHDGDRDRALELYRTVLGHDPENPSKRWQLVNALIDADQLADALEAARALSRYDAASNVLRARARGRAADVLWLQGKLEDAADIYTELLSEPLDDGSRRRYTVCALAVRRPDKPLRDGIRDYLLNRLEDRDDALAHLKTLTAAFEDDPIGHYLLGRRLFAAREYEGAYQSLGRALDVGLWSVLLQRAAHEQRGIVRLYTDRPREAARHFEKARALHDSAGFRARLADWLDRCLWMEEKSNLGT